MYRDLFIPIILILIVVCLVALIAYIIYLILRNPFKYPYFTHEFNVSNKRNVDITDYIDKYLCNERNWDNLCLHQQHILNWKNDTEAYLSRCHLKHYRTKQYHNVLDDRCAFCFETTRRQTRYRQKNYVKTSYQVFVSDDEADVSWQWLVHRHEQLKAIGFELTLKEYYNKNQRKLMTKTLRKQIMERDNYTCQLCGKHMPDEVGLHIDHIIPVAKGGKTVPSNLQVLCSKCNGNKGTKTTYRN